MSMLLHTGTDMSIWWLKCNENRQTDIRLVSIKDDGTDIQMSQLEIPEWESQIDPDAMPSGNPEGGEAVPYSGARTFSEEDLATGDGENPDAAAEDGGAGEETPAEGEESTGGETQAEGEGDTGGETPAEGEESPGEGAEAGHAHGCLGEFQL